MKRLGCLFSVSDPDARYYDQMLAQMTRLGWPFAVNFDHCSPYTKKAFQSHPLYIGGYENDDPKRPFDESHRQTALDVIVKSGVDWACRFDIDEVLDRRAERVIPEIMAMDMDLVWCPCLDLWGDDKHYRVDGPFGPEQNPDARDVLDKQFRKMFYNLSSGTWRFLAPDVHAPELFINGRLAQPRMFRSKLHVIHYGLMSYVDTAFKRKRWDEIYTRALGHNPYTGIYEYMNDRSVIPQTRPFDWDTFSEV